MSLDTPDDPKGDLNARDSNDPTSHISTIDPSEQRKISYQSQETVYRWGKRVSTAIIGFVMIFPLYWMFQSAFTARDALLTDDVQYFPTGDAFTISEFSILFDSTVGMFFLNSVIVTSGTVLLTVTLSLVAGYALARLDFKGKTVYAKFLLLGYMFSAIIIGLPLYLLYRNLGLTNTRIGLILVLTVVSLPFGVWVMWKYIQTIPESLEESAWINGASRWRGFKDVVLPQCAPGIVAVALFAFAIAWNDFTFAQILNPSQSAMTFPPGMLRLVQDEYVTNWGGFMAAGVTFSIPSLLFAYFLQSYLLKGFEVRSSN